MTKRMKKLTAMLLTAAMTISMVPVAAIAAEVNPALVEAVEELTLPYDEVYGNITLPAKGDEDIMIEWESSHPEIIDTEEHENENYDSTPAGVVTRPEHDTYVKLTANLTSEGITLSKDFMVKVKAAPEELTDEDLTDYFFAYFAGEGYSNGEQIYFAASQDGLNWTDLNENQPVLYSSLGEQGVRDPFIIRSAEGDKFFMIATDLKINNGNGWGAAQTAGSQSIMVWESTDLVNWSEQRMVPISASIDSGCTWAPESYYDEVTGEYIVFWASKVKADNYSKQRLYYAKTRDFYSFTEPEVFIEMDQSSIDTTIMYDETTNMYYRYTKNEGGGTNSFGARSKTVYAEKSETLLGEWTHIPSDSLNSNGGVEGPSIFKFNADDSENGAYCLLVDNYGAGGYYPLVSTDLSTGVFSRPDSYKMPSRARHGTPVQVTADEYASVMAAWGPDDQLDTSSLEAKIDKAWEVDSSLYTDDSYDEFESAIFDAEAELDYVESMDDVARAVSTLEAAYDLLVPVVESLEVIAPDKTVYEVGEDLDLTGYFVSAIGADGSAAAVTESAKVSGYDANKEGRQTITVTYEDVEATFEVVVGDETVKLPFTDVAEADWFYNSVSYVYTKNLMTGMDDTTFGPYGQLSRAQFALILYRMEGSPEVTATSKFGDIAGDEWYGKAVLWAAENGIVTGYQNGNFGPVDMVTREQMAIMMYRYAKYLGKDITATGDISGFVDVASVSEFAVEGMKWANGKGIITGKDNGTKLDPQGNTARAEAAAIIERFMNN